MKCPCFFIALIALNCAGCTTKRKEPTNLDYSHWWTMKPGQIEKLMREKKGWRSISEPVLLPFRLSYANGDTVVNYYHSSEDTCLYLIDMSYRMPLVLSTPQGKKDAREDNRWVDSAEDVETYQRERPDGVVEESFRSVKSGR